jgi:hypothetical protein
MNVPIFCGLVFSVNHITLRYRCAEKQRKEKMSLLLYYYMKEL